MAFTVNLPAVAKLKTTTPLLSETERGPDWRGEVNVTVSWLETFPSLSMAVTVRVLEPSARELRRPCGSYE